jgi:hypothetical protein
MTRKILTAKLLSLVLGSVFLTGLLPLSNHMLSMDSAAYQSRMDQGNTSDTSTDTCCEAIGACLLTCDFMVFPSAYIGQKGGREQVTYSNPIIQLIYIEILAPPPKA